MGYSPHRTALDQMGIPHSGRLCQCGSKKERYALNDAAGIFCTYVCEDCEDRARQKYRAEIFESGTRYAATGDEQDLGGE